MRKLFLITITTLFLSSCQIQNTDLKVLADAVQQDTLKNKRQQNVKLHTVKLHVDSLGNKCDSLEYLIKHTK